MKLLKKNGVEIGKIKEKMLLLLFWINPILFVA